MFCQNIFAWLLLQSIELDPKDTMCEVAIYPLRMRLVFELAMKRFFKYIVEGELLLEKCNAVSLCKFYNF